MKIYKEWLNRNGIHFEEASFGLVFRYQGCTFIISNNNADDCYLQLVLPHIDDDVRGDKKVKALSALNQINRTVKCLKGTLNDAGEVWLATEIFVEKNPNIDDFFERLLDVLMLGRLEYVKSMAL